MLDSLTWFVDILGTVIGIAGTLSACCVMLILAAFLKKLPTGLKRFLSALAAGMIIFSVFKELAVQNFTFAVYKSVFGWLLAGRLFDVSLLICVISVLFGKAFFRRDSVSIREEMPFDEPDVVNSANQSIEFLSIPSVFRKISPVILQ